MEMRYPGRFFAHYQITVVFLLPVAPSEFRGTFSFKYRALWKPECIANRCVSRHLDFENLESLYAWDSVFVDVDQDFRLKMLHQTHDKNALNK